MFYKGMNNDGWFAAHDRVDHSESEYARYEDGRPVIHTNTVERQPSEHRFEFVRGCTFIGGDRRPLFGFHAPCNVAVVPHDHIAS